MARLIWAAWAVTNPFAFGITESIIGAARQLAALFISHRIILNRWLRPKLVGQHIEPPNLSLAGAKNGRLPCADMNLEDNLGDVIRKARMMSNTSAAVAAVAAGVTESELSELEASGTFSRRPNFTALAAAVGLNAGKLEAIANGWLPRKPDLTRWRELRMLTTAGDGMTVNCYLVWDADTREAALFDTGFDAKPIQETIAAHKLQLRHVFITHSHPDHIAALGPIRAAFPTAKVHSSSKNAPVEQRNQTGEIVALNRLQIAHRATPGHAEDGVTYIVSHWPDNAPLVAIVGDAIFAGSMGGGNNAWELARSKVREEILTLPAETLICAGHGPLTTVAEEMANNPFYG